jgi:thiamine biosynthesis protein ThiS
VALVIQAQADAGKDEIRFAMRTRAKNPGGRRAMTVTINGERREVPDGMAVSALLEHLGMPRERVAIEHNLNILPRADWNATLVQPNDSFEIVHFVGGG